MKFVSRGGTLPAKVEALAELGKGASLRARITLALTHELLQL
jgi:hypothetical protein